MPEVIISNHAQYQLTIERKIDIHEVVKIAKHGRVFKIDTDGSISKVGDTYDSRELIVVMIKKGSKIIVVTAYYNDN